MRVSATTLGRAWPLLLSLVLLLPALAACSPGSGDDEPERTGQIIWYQGEPPATETDQPAAVPEEPATETVIEQPTAELPTPTPPPPEPTSPPQPEQPEPGATLTPEELARYRPNELGDVPVLMYHNIVPEYGPGQEGDVLWRTIDEFKADLAWLYEQNFYVIPFYDYVTGQISAPAGKKPIVLTFDDSRPNQFNYLIAEDGSVTIDPNSAIGILEAFFDAHPDFGRTAFFSILPIWCFDYDAPDQTPYCQQKLEWLVANGYEIGNHTWDHQSLADVSNEIFMQKVTDASLWLEEQVPAGKASRILILPYGVFPGGDNALEQWQMIRNGWTYNGEPFQLLSVVAAGANPAYSPWSVEFDIMSIARIGAKDYPGPGEADLFLDFWFGQFEANPGRLYISDGNPDTITFPSAYADLLDEEKAAAAGKQVIVYD